MQRKNRNVNIITTIIPKIIQYRISQLEQELSQYKIDFMFDKYGNAKLPTEGGAEPGELTTLLGFKNTVNQTIQVKDILNQQEYIHTYN